MADFTTSSHRKRWILNPHDLTRKYEAANQRAVDALQKCGATRVEIQSDGSLIYPGGSGGGENGRRESLPEHLSIEEELLVKRYYEGKIQEVCAALRLPNKIQATAIIYFKRFYLQWSIMEHDHKNILLTCIYLACKVEESHVSAEELGKGIQQDPQVVLKNEMIVLQALEFELIVYPPYRSMEGFIYDLETFVQGMGSTGLKALQGSRVWFWNVTLIIYFCEFLVRGFGSLQLSEGQLALAALRIANQNQSKVDFD
nr:cyclin-H1-1-like isoform X3 [Physcomitrium patens]|eukprot:XP_024367255.1 cyclin-H1-1-like isoform X3 [Physcomitrella patens]